MGGERLCAFFYQVLGIIFRFRSFGLSFTGLSQAQRLHGIHFTGFCFPLFLFIFFCPGFRRFGSVPSMCFRVLLFGFSSWSFDVAPKAHSMQLGSDSWDSRGLPKDPK